MSNKNYNPRGFKRPKDGRGKGVGMNNGLRNGINNNPCNLNVKNGTGNGMNRSDKNG